MVLRHHSAKSVLMWQLQNKKSPRLREKNYFFFLYTFPFKSENKSGREKIKISAPGSPFSISYISHWELGLSDSGLINKFHVS